jgi:hypothetical protein
MTANLKAGLLALARAWRAAPVSVRMPACAARNYGHLWPDRGAPFDGFDGEGRLLGGYETARPAAPQPEPCATCAASCWSPPCVRWAAWAWGQAERRRADERRQQDAPKADPFDEYVKILRTGTHE